MGFKEMKMMKSTEPSVDEVGKGMKKGGKPKMQMGGVPPLAAAAAPARGMPARAMPARRPMPARPMPARPMPARPMGGGPTAPVNMDKLNQVKALTAAASRPTPSRTMGPMKKGGEVAKVKKELMTHESKPASKAHKGLKTGGIAGYKTGGLIQKYATGGVVNGAAGYKDGGFAKVACKDGGGFKAMKKGNC
jgi:hypothetical protein